MIKSNFIPVIEAHSDIATDIIIRRQSGENKILDRYHYDRLFKGGINLQVIAVYVEARDKPYKSLENTFMQIESLLEDIEESDKFFLITKKDDLLRVGQEDKIGVLIDLEGAEALEPGIEMLDLIHRLGVRMLGLTWNQRNLLASGIGDMSSRGGLTSMGIEVIKKMKNLGMILDVSHLSPVGVDDVLCNYDGIVIASHAGASSVYYCDRNLSDDHIRRIAKTGGVIGIPAFPSLLSNNKTSIETVVNHIDKIINLVGEDHVGIGADFVDYFEPLIKKGLLGTEWIVQPEDITKNFNSASDFPKLRTSLKKRGYSEEIIRKIMGENFFRVFLASLR